ncbi:hypothetical protein E2I00_019549 [Balaenoptera physalus]|uniref:Uncharacterized protein n=1 Tax=Balaenoptera physalus TaxID=9770 RepID=A0A6A1Q1T1_BALPH|nr:hypothetical protein E2I00_019549 [Balaenoptera physalus]
MVKRPCAGLPLPSGSVLIIQQEGPVDTGPPAGESGWAPGCEMKVGLGSASCPPCEQVGRRLVPGEPCQPVAPLTPAPQLALPAIRGPQPVTSPRHTAQPRGTLVQAQNQKGSGLFMVQDGRDFRVSVAMPASEVEDLSSCKVSPHSQVGAPGVGLCPIPPGLSGNCLQALAVQALRVRLPRADRLG